MARSAVVRALLVCLLASLATVPVASAPAGAGAARRVGSPLITEPSSPLEARFLALLNAERRDRGLRPLVWDDALAAAGRQHSQEMARLGYFDHTSPVRGWETPADRWERFTPLMPDEYTLGENLFFGTEPDPEWGHGALMESRDHRANMLAPEYARVGIGVFVAPDGRMWVTQMFLS